MKYKSFYLYKLNLLTKQSEIKAYILDIKDDMKTANEINQIDVNKLKREDITILSNCMHSINQKTEQVSEEVKEMHKIMKKGTKTKDISDVAELNLINAESRLIEEDLSGTLAQTEVCSAKTSETINAFFTLEQERILNKDVSK